MRKILLIISCMFLCLVSSVNAATPKNWTFLIFLNADNNLDPFDSDNIRAMEKIGSNDQVNIVVQWANKSAGKAVRMLIKKSNDPSQITSPVVQELGLVDMGDYQSLQEFIKWGVQKYPANHYFIDVWSHGNGWYDNDDNILPQIQPTVVSHISMDDNTGHVITVEQLGQVMKYAAKLIGHKVDVYGSDACLMAMVEVADEMSKSVQLFVGSQEDEPKLGWPYADFISRWEATPNATPEQVANILTETYVTSYANGANGTDNVTFSAFDLSHLEAFHRAMSDFSANVRALNADEKAMLKNAASHTQRFSTDDYADLIDFTKKISVANIPGMKADVINHLQKATHDLVIANKDTTGYANATGLSIWLPTNPYTYHFYAKRYAALNFNVQTHWGDALGDLFPYIPYIPP